MGFDLMNIVQLAGGLALFIYGMTTMGKAWNRLLVQSWKRRSKK